MIDLSSFSRPLLAPERSLGVLGTVLLTITAAVTLNIIYCTLFHPLRRVPGPFFAKVTEGWRTWRYACGTWHEDILQLHRKYGPVVRVSPSEISIVDKDGLNRVFGHGKGTRKTAWYDTWKTPNFGNSFFHSLDPAEHSFLRKRVASAYSMTTILSLEPEIQDVAAAVFERFDEAVKNKQRINMHDWASYFAFDVVGKLALGAPIGFVEQAKDVFDIVKSIHGGFWLMAILGYVPGQMMWINNPLTKFLLGLLSNIDGSTFPKWVVRQIANRRAEPEGARPKLDMLDHYISMKEPDGGPATDESVRVEASNMIGAGADTTSIGVRTVLAQLILHPEDYLKVQKEVDDAFSKLPEDSQGRLPYVKAEKLAHLSACIKEALRLHPSIVWQLPREAPAEGVDIAGYYIPPSATISMSPLAQNRNRMVFGPSADEWRPARWIPGKGSSEEDLRQMDKNLATFGYGSRTCIGRNLALVEIHNFIAGFVHRYNARFTNAQRPFVLKSQWFSYQADMFLDLESRSSAEAQRVG